MNSSTKRQVTASNGVHRPPSILITGLSGAGKKTIVSMVKYGKNPDTSSIIGVDLEELTINEIPLTVWSVGGRSGIRSLVTQYYQRMSAFIFVVDSNDHQRMYEAREQLHHIANSDHFEEKPILIFANKSDLPNAMNHDRLRDELHLDKLHKNIKWHLQSASAIQNQGLHQGFDWIVNTIQNANDPTKRIFEPSKDATILKHNLLSSFNLTKFTVFMRKMIFSSLDFIERAVKR